MSDFNGDDFEFAAGSIKGMRTWRADDQGRLRGVTHPMVWLPGENVSTCRIGGGGRYTPCPKARTGDGWYVTFGRPTCEDPVCTPRGHYAAPSEDKRHHFDPECECGFWAYDEDHYTNHGDVCGVIEGYGRTTIGTKGFRCEKARIVALCREAGDRDVSLSLWLRLQQLYPAAQFFEDYDEMVTAHGAVLRSYDAIGDDFWNVPADEPKRYAAGGLVMPYSVPHLTFTPRPISWNGGVA